MTPRAKGNVSSKKLSSFGSCECVLEDRKAGEDVVARSFVVALRY